MTKVKVIETFATPTYSGRKGETVAIPRPEAVKLASCGLVSILPDNEQDPVPMAYETAKQAAKAQNAKMKIK